MTESIGGIGSGGTSAFDLGGIAPNGGGPAPSGLGDLGAAGLSPIGGNGLTSFGLSGPVGAEAAKAQHFDKLMQDNTAMLKGIAADYAAEIGRPGSAAQAEAPGYQPPASMPPSFQGQALGPFAPGALASSATSPAIDAPTITDPFAPREKGGLGLNPITPSGLLGFAAMPASVQATLPTMREVQEEPGFFGRASGRIADNFTTAFQAPLGPGGWYDRWTAPSGYGALDMVSQPFWGGVKGALALGDAALRGAGAGYYSLVDTGTEALVSAGMQEGDAYRLGRDLKAWPEAFAGGAGSLAGSWGMRASFTLRPVAEGYQLSFNSTARTEQLFKCALAPTAQIR